MKRALISLPILVGALLACNLSASGRLSESQVATFAAGTVAALEATRAALPVTETPPVPTVAPTDTPFPASPTPIPPSPTAGASGCTDLAGFVSDVTIPDDSPIEAGAGFVKTWRLRNNGTCTWTSSYSVVFDHGDKMSGPDAQPLSGAVAPGDTMDVSVSLTAPASPGTYQGYWMLRNNSGVLFGLGGNAAFFVKIVVPGTPTPTATGSIFMPGIIVTLVPLIYTSSGNDAGVASGSCFDLDAGAAAGCASGEADFRYVFTLFPPDEVVAPTNGARFRFFHATALPTSAECQALALGGGVFDANSNVYCYQTSAGKFGWLRVDSASFALQFDWGTYTFP